LCVSEVSLGTVELGMDYGIRTGAATNQPSEAEAARLLHRALDLGINFIDTAAAYGTSEEIIGRALRDRREGVVLATKCMHYYEQGVPVPEIRKQISASIDRSLRRLQTDRIDLMQVHGRDRLDLERRMIEEGEVFDVLDRARKAGKIRFIGYSSYGEAASMAALNDGRWDTLQFAYNMFDQRAVPVVMPAARARDIGIVVRSALLKGALTEKARHLPPPLKPLADRTARLAALLSGTGLSLPQAALRFVLSHPDVGTVIVGADRISYLEEAVSVSDGQGLPEEVLAFSRTLALDAPDLINPGAGGIP
jgi:aryl-alcohol dehydrogenase-like predicted oxidoreductase